MMGYILRHNEELHSITERYDIKRSDRGHGRPRTSYTSKIIKDARIGSYKQLKGKVYDRDSWRDNLLYTNLQIECSKKKKKYLNKKLL